MWSSVQFKGKSIRTQKKTVHEGINYPCGKCTYQASNNGNLTQHRRAVHEGVKYPCGQCSYQATSKSHIVRHQRNVHEKVK